MQPITRRRTIKSFPQHAMKLLSQAIIITLALVAPALAAPGPTFSIMHQKPMNKSMNMTAGIHIPPIVYPPPISPPPDPGNSPAASAQTTMMSSPMELVKRGSNKQKPCDNPCTPGDRYCHASLDNVLVCNDDSQWVKYAECPAGTFCHRLFMVCVKEVFRNGSKSRPHGVQYSAESSNQCREGDRRCSASFNRVDRCNSKQDWVSYHDCRKSESCNKDILECLPLTG